jgi:RNA polymerase-binding transcription factor DksA
MADHGSDNYEQDFNLQLLEGESEQLADIRDALLKIDGKLDLPFGICEACIDSALKLCETCPWIPESRLGVLPHARLCVPTKEMQEDGKLGG